MTGEPALWVYAVTPTGSALPSGCGVDGEALRRVAHAGLAAVVSAVGWAGRPGVLEQELRDPKRLETVARAHHEVVEACFRSGPTVPFRLGTLYRSDEGVRDLLAQRGEELATALTMVAGRVEWGVQAYAVTSHDPSTATDEPNDTAPPGTAYLLRRRSQRMARERAERSAWEAASQVDAALTAVAVAARSQSSVGAAWRRDTVGTQVLNMSYLVEEAAGDQFRTIVGQLARRYPGLALRVTGPWPAYSFVEFKGGGEG